MSPSGGPEWVLEYGSFTSTDAMAREIEAWLKFSECRLTVVVKSKRQKEDLFNFLEGYKTKGRVKVEEERGTVLAVSGSAIGPRLVRTTFAERVPYGRKDRE